MKTKFFKCMHCGNVVVKCVDSGVPVVCCGDEMTELQPLCEQNEEVGEKHVPVVDFLSEKMIRVKVGSLPHPSTPMHHIDFIYVETQNGGMMHKIVAPAPAQAEFVFGDDVPTIVFAYCNLHGLWMTKI